VPGSAEAFEAQYPAQFICEALDQTRGWFYSLMAVGTILFDRSSYENVVCLGLLLAEDGRKMSKHLGNILEPIPLMEEHGADALRWFMAAGGSPWSARRVGHAAIQEAVRKVLLTYWNTVAFHVLYARANGWAPHPADAPRVEDRPALDRWLVSRRSRLVRDVTAALEQFDTQRTGQLLADFIDGLSNWYVRRSRRRFWDGDDAALTTLHETLDVLTRLLAPLTPFITERVWQDLVVPVDEQAPDSVHLADWPVFDAALVDDDLDAAMALTQRLVELGRAARSEAGVKTRQPLRRALVPARVLARLDPALRAEIAAELNVAEVDSFASAGDVVDYAVRANFRSLGKRFGARTPEVAQAIAGADAEQLARELGDGGSARLDFDGGIDLAADDVIVSERPREGWSVVNEHGETIALDLTLSPDLVRAGLAREVVRLVQEARKSAGFAVSYRISLPWAAVGDVAEALREHGDLLARETLAVTVAEADGVERADVSDAGLGLSISLQKAPRD
jgi:isoleucyl-tRNA synthetase